MFKGISFQVLKLSMKILSRRALDYTLRNLKQFVCFVNTAVR